MKLRLFYLWLLALAKKQVAADVLAAFHQQHAKLQTLLAAANTAPGRAALEKFLKTATSGARPSRIYASQNERYYGSAPILNLEAPTAALAGKKVTLWVAADEAQQKALAALIPTPQPGQQLNPNDLPKTIPASIRLKPQIRVEGELKAEGGVKNVGR